MPVACIFDGVKPAYLLLLFNFFKTSCLFAQTGNQPDSIQVATSSTWQQQHDSIKNNRNKIYLVSGVHVAGYAGTLLVLGAAWYSGYAKTPFHTFNDNGEWLQMDKAGHAWTAYNIANYSSRLWYWSGISSRKAALLGGISALGYQTILEYLDGRSAAWGWSWGDMGANTFGAALFTSQQMAWGSQKVVLKFSSFPQRYDAALQPRADALFGKTFPERLLKDYNAQTYWLSMNLQSVFQNSIPAWLNVAVGYGAKGMYGGFKNIAVDKNGTVIFDRTDIERVRQWYLSPDIDWTKIKTNKRAVRTFLVLLNMIKMPAPALELSNGKVKAHWISF